MPASQLETALLKAQNRAVAARVLVSVDNIDGNNELVLLAPEGLTEDEAHSKVLEIAEPWKTNSELSDLSQALFEAGFAVFEKFTTVDRC